MKVQIALVLLVGIATLASAQAPATAPATAPDTAPAPAPAPKNIDVTTVVDDIIRFNPTLKKSFARLNKLTKNDPRMKGLTELTTAIDMLAGKKIEAEEALNKKEAEKAEKENKGKKSKTPKTPKEPKPIKVLTTLQISHKVKDLRTVIQKLNKSLNTVLDTYVKNPGKALSADGWDPSKKQVGSAKKPTAAACKKPAACGHSGHGGKGKPAKGKSANEGGYARDANCCCCNIDPDTAECLGDCACCCCICLTRLCAEIAVDACLAGTLECILNGCVENSECIGACIHDVLLALLFSR